MASVGFAVDAVELAESAGRGYEVEVDPATLCVVDMGARGTGYSVGLAGRLDGAWILSFREVQADAKSYARFALDPRVSRVSFLRLADDGPVDVINALETLDELVGLANRFAREG
jgi:hypothetical protein